MDIRERYFSSPSRLSVKGSISPLMIPSRSPKAWAASRSAGLRKIVPSTSNEIRDQEELRTGSPGFEGIAEGRSTWNPSAPARREVNKELTTGLGTPTLGFVI